MFFAVLLDKNVRGTRIYQSALYMPVVLSLAIIGFIWDLIYAPEQGLINNILGRTSPNNEISWLGNPSLNLWAILIAASWRQVGYVMILYLAGLKGFGPGPAGGRGDRRGQRVPDLFPRRLPGHAPDQHRDPRDHRHRVAPRLRPRLHHQPRAQRARAALDARHEQHHRRDQPDRVRLGDRGCPARHIRRPDPLLSLPGAGEENE